jgi:hypothetical protein
MPQGPPEPDDGFDGSSVIISHFRHYTFAAPDTCAQGLGLLVARKKSGMFHGNQSCSMKSRSAEGQGMRLQHHTIPPSTTSTQSLSGRAINTRRSARTWASTRCPRGGLPRRAPFRTAQDQTPPAAETLPHQEFAFTTTHTYRTSGNTRQTQFIGTKGG